MNVTTTERGFERIDFTDANGQACSLQQSSAFREDGARPGASMLWLGIIAGRMHLDRSQVTELVRHLQAWLETGSLKPE